jgi:hypothetical protein
MNRRCQTTDHSRKAVLPLLTASENDGHLLASLLNSTASISKIKPQCHIKPYTGMTMKPLA